MEKSLRKMKDMYQGEAAVAWVFWMMIQKSQATEKEGVGIYIVAGYRNGA